MSKFDATLVALVWLCFWVFAITDLAVDNSGLGIPAVMAFVMVQWMEWYSHRRANARRPNESSDPEPRSQHG